MRRPTRPPDPGAAARKKLEPLPLKFCGAELTETVTRLVAGAEAAAVEVRAYVDRIPAFAASDFAAAFRLLRGVREQCAEDGNGKPPTLCEWGSGCGGVACVASAAGFASVGVEIENRLVQVARRLAADHRLDVVFHHGTYRPPGYRDGRPDIEQLRAEQGFCPFDFDIVYAYPWPAEERIIYSLFDQFAAPRSQLVTYHGGGVFRRFRKR